LPLAFEPNEGQTTANFLAHGSGYTLLLSADQATLGLQQAASPGSSGPNALGSAGTTEVLSMRLMGDNPAATASGLNKLAGVSNYLIGNNPADWHTNIPTYSQVEYQNVYPGINQIYYGNQGQLEYDLVVNPGANPGTIRLQISGAQSMTLDANGNLVLHTPGGDVIEEAPVVYQEVNGVRQDVAGRYVLEDNNQVGFAVGAYDAGLPLTIDPILSYSTYLGGSGGNQGAGIAVDSAGNAYVTGFTSSTNFPTANPLRGTLDGTSDVFVSKLNAQGSALVYSTYLGGSGSDLGNAIAVDARGDAYLTGQTDSSDFPTVNAFQRTLKSGPPPGADSFVAELNPAGNALVYSSYLGGSGTDQGTGIAVGPAGNAYVTGHASSTDFPTANALQPTLKTTQGNAFVTKLNAQGSLLYSTYLGGTGGDGGLGIAADAAGDAYVAGYTASSDFPTANAFQSTRKGGFVTKINPQGSGLVYSTYLGGSAGGDQANAIAVDAAGNTYVTGRTFSTDFPTANAFQKTLKGAVNAFVTKLNPQGSAPVYSTYLGGSNADFGGGIAIDAAGNAYVTGITDSTNFPIVNALQTSLKGTVNAFVTMVNAQGNALAYSTYLGGSGNDNAAAIAVDGSGSAYVTGYTSSTDFPTASALESSPPGPSNAFVTKILSHAFNGQDVAVDATGHAQLLWDSVNGQHVQWSVDNSLDVAAGPVFGPLSGWSAVANAGGADGLTRVLWTDTDGRSALWLEDASGMPLDAAVFSAISGWTPRDVTVGSDGDTRILWTNANGAIEVWKVDDNFNVTSSPVYGPLSGWTAVRIAAGADGLTRVLWDNSNGASAVWLLNASGSFVNAGVFGPFAGWTATDITVGPDNLTRILWDNVNGGALIWSVSNSFAVTSTPVFGPLAGWTAERLEDGSDGIVRLLWDNVDGQASLWLLDAGGDFLKAGVFGPM
jgi:hypothetical protein